VGAEAALWIFFAGGCGGAAGRNNPNISSALGEHCARGWRNVKRDVPSLFRAEFIAPGERARHRHRSATLLFSQAAVAHSCLVNQQVFLLNGATAWEKIRLRCQVAANCNRHPLHLFAHTSVFICGNNCFVSLISVRMVDRLSSFH